MDRNSFFKAIASASVSGAYMLFGEEWYVMDRAVERLASLADGAARDMNLIYFDSGAGRDISAACDTPPFLAEKRVVIVRFIPRDTDGAELVKYIPSLPDYTVLLFVVRTDEDHKLDRRASLVKYFEANKRTVEFASLSENEAAKWLLQQSSASGVTLAEADARYLARVAGTDCATLSNELHKAADYVGDGGTVTKEVINAVVIKNIDFVVFSVLDETLAGRAADGLSALRGLMANGERALGIASLIGDKARLILQARRHIDKKRPKEAALKALGVSPGYAARVYDAALKLRPAKIEPLRAFSAELCDVTLKQLSGRGRDSELLEAALLKLGAS